MKAIGINAIVLDDNCEVICREGTMIRAVLNKDGQISYQDIFELNTLSQIKEYSDLPDFIEDTINAAKSEFGSDFNEFQIVGIDDNNNQTWAIKCSIAEEDIFYTFADFTDRNIKFIETLIKEN